MSLTGFLVAYIGNTLDMIKELKISLTEPAVIIMQPTIALCCLLDSSTEYVFLL